MSENIGEQLPEPEKVEATELHEKSLAEIDLSGVIESLREYNEKCNPHFSIWKELDEPGSQNFSKEAVEEGRKQELKSILEKYKVDLSRTGLNLETVDTEVKTTNETGTMAIQIMRMNLSDSKKFINYLDSFADINPSESQSKSLQTLAHILEQQLADQYELGNPDDESMVEIMGNLSKIIKKYEGFDKEGGTEFSESVSGLSRYLEIGKKKYLKEFLLAQRMELIDKQGRLEGLSSWYFGGEKYYPEYWDKILAVVGVIGENPNAKKFQKELINHLKVILKSHKKDINRFEKDLEAGNDTDPRIRMHLRQPEKNKNIDEKLERWRIIIDEIYEKLESLDK